MAFEYFLYNTSLNNTLVNRSATSFAPLPPNTGEIFINFLIPDNQPLYLYRESGGTIILNDEQTINTYILSNDMIDGDSNVTFYQLTGYTATTVSDFVSKATFDGYTGTTAPTTYQSKASVAVYTGTTAPNQFAAKTNFNTFTGTTAPATYQTKSSITTYTGTTAPATYQTKSSINTLTGTTLPATYQTKASVSVYTGTTAPAQFAAKSNFNTFTGTTAPATYQTKASIATYTGTTVPNQFAAKTNFNTFTGTTAPATYLTKTAFNSYSALTLTSINNRLLISSFNTYSGATLTNINSRLLTSAFNTYSANTVTYANNGLTRNGANVRLGGTLTGGTTITSPATGSRLSFAGFPVQYATDVSANYNVRSLVDRGFVTGITTTLTTSANNGITKSGQNFRLGGTLTGNTTITSATGSRFNIAGWAMQYASDLSGTFNPRSLVDMGYVTAITSTLTTTANNGLNKIGSNFRLGGSLTGSTMITTSTSNRLNFDGFPIQYTIDFTSNFTPRSIVDKGYVTGITSTLLSKTDFNTFSGTTLPNTYNHGITWRNGGFPLGGGFPSTKISDVRFTSGITGSLSTGSLIVSLTDIGSLVKTANNGLTRTGTNVGLGGELSGTTTISSATARRLNFAGWPVQYATDLSANYNPRSLVDKAYVTGLTSQIVYGTQYQLATSLGSTSTSSTTPVAKLTMTTSNLPSGTYKITVHWVWSRDSAANSARFNVTIGGIAQGTRSQMEFEAKDTTDVVPVTRIFHVELSGVNTIVLNHWGESGGNVTTTSDASIELIRVV